VPEDEHPETDSAAGPRVRVSRVGFDWLFAVAWRHALRARESDYEFERGHFLATVDPAQVFHPNVDFVGELPKAHLAILASCPEDPGRKVLLHSLGYEEDDICRTGEVERSIRCFCIDNVIDKSAIPPLQNYYLLKQLPTLSAKLGIYPLHS
jgi:hypothetical protein